MNNEYLYTNITSNTTTTITDRPCILHSVTVNKAAAGAITINDGTTDTVATLKTSVAEGTYTYDVVLKNYLQVITAGSPDITVAYKPTA